MSSSVSPHADNDRHYKSDETEIPPKDNESKSHPTTPHPFHLTLFPSFSPSHRLRRSPLITRHFSVTSSDSICSQVGMQILLSGGNAADASVAIAAALGVRETHSTGIGGDLFAIFYNAKTKSLHGINASGKSPKLLTLEQISTSHQMYSTFPSRISRLSPHSITVPGTVAGWDNMRTQWGSGLLTLGNLLQPAITMCEEGTPISLVTSEMWKSAESSLQNDNGGRELLNAKGKAPAAGELWKNIPMAKSLRDIAENGTQTVYKGNIAKSIVQMANKVGSLLSLDDLSNHTNEFPSPLSVSYQNIILHEFPPNGQGITALMALNILKYLPYQRVPYGSSLHYHQLIEALRLAFVDCRYFVTDNDTMEQMGFSTDKMLSEKYAKERAKLINMGKSLVDVQRGSPFSTSNTVSFGVVDKEGNACSVVNSNFMPFGSCIVPTGCGFPLQNRGSCFSLESGHPNVLEGGKRPYHTIIPGMLTNHKGELIGPFSCMGGYNQPQGHIQLLINMVEYGMDSQMAVDSPRFCIEEARKITVNGEEKIVSYVAMEKGVDEKVIEELRAMGHMIRIADDSESLKIFGRAQVIWKDDNGVLWSGSDSRCDGTAVGM